jgi:hypothetical protein
MKTLKFETLSGDQLVSNIYGGGTCKLSFALCKTPARGKIEQLAEFLYCRENVMYRVPKNINHLPKRNTWIAIHKSLSATDEATKESHNFFKEHVEKAIKLLNHYEKRNDWLESVVFRAEHEKEKSNPVYIIKSSKWWSHSPHLFSMYMLLIRIAEEKAFDNIRRNSTNEKVLEFIHSISNKSRDYVKTRNAEVWNVLVDKRKEIYDNRTVRENFDIVSRYDSSEGLLKLSRGTCNDYQTFERFSRFCKDVGVWK